MNPQTQMLAAIISKSLNLGDEWTVVDVEMRECDPDPDELHFSPIAGEASAARLSSSMLLILREPTNETASARSRSSSTLPTLTASAAAAATERPPSVASADAPDENLASRRSLP